MCGTSHDLRESLWMLRIKMSTKILHFGKILKIHQKNCKSANFFYYGFRSKKNAKRLSNNESFEIEDRPEDLLLSAEFIVLYPMWQIFLFLNAVMRHFWVSWVYKVPRLILDEPLLLN